MNSSCQFRESHHTEDSAEFTDLPFIRSNMFLFLVPSPVVPSFRQVEIASGEDTFDNNVEYRSDASGHGQSFEGTKLSLTNEAEFCIPRSKGGRISRDDELMKECD